MYMHFCFFPAHHYYHLQEHCNKQMKKKKSWFAEHGSKFLLYLIQLPQIIIGHKKCSDV